MEGKAASNAEIFRAIGLKENVVKSTASSKKASKKLLEVLAMVDV